MICVWRRTLAHIKDELFFTLQNVGGKCATYGFRRVRCWLFDDKLRNLLECRTLWASWSDAVYGLVYIQCIEIRFTIVFIWLALGCESCRWMDASSPLSTDLGMMISSLEGTNGSFRFTTSSLLFGIIIVATLRQRLMSLMLVALREGRVPWRRWAQVLLKSEHSGCIANRADLVVNGSFS